MNLSLRTPAKTFWIIFKGYTTDGKCYENIEDAKVEAEILASQTGERHYVLQAVCCVERAAAPIKWTHI